MPDKSGFDHYLSDLSPKDKPWDKNRGLSDRIEVLCRNANLDQPAIRVSNCAQSLSFAFQAADAGEMKLRLRAAYFCRYRHCPVCQWRRSLSWKAKFFQVLPKVLEDYPSHRWLSLTLTVRNCSLTELRSTISLMNAAWKRMSERKAFPAIGSVRCLEVTRGEDSSAHPHFHALLLVPSSYFSHGYIPHAEWVALWKRSLRVDYDPILHIKPVQNRRRRAIEGLDVDLPVEVISALLETVKYITKPADLLKTGNPVEDARWFGEYATQVHKTRAIAVGGILRNYLSEQEPDDLINVDGEESESLEETEMRMLFAWKKSIQRYTKIEEE